MQDKAYLNPLKEQTEFKTEFKPTGSLKNLFKYYHRDLDNGSYIHLLSLLKSIMCFAKKLEKNKIILS